MDCVFCKITAGQIPSNKVLENDEFLAFHDIAPKAPVHVLIIKKKHIENFNALDSATASGIVKFAQEVAVATGVEKAGYRLITNCGENGGQEVPHLHFHLLGGKRLLWLSENSAADPKKSF